MIYMIELRQNDIKELKIFEIIVKDIVLCWNFHLLQILNIMNYFKALAYLLDEKFDKSLALEQDENIKEGKKRIRNILNILKQFLKR